MTKQEIKILMNQSAYKNDTGWRHTYGRRVSINLVWNTTLFCVNEKQVAKLMQDKATPTGQGKLFSLRISVSGDAGHERERKLDTPSKSERRKEKKGRERKCEEIDRSIDWKIDRQVDSRDKEKDGDRDRHVDRLADRQWERQVDSRNKEKYR